MITAVIIDDISLARASLRADLTDHYPDVNIIGEAEGVVSGLKLIKTMKPELIFLDIHMTDGEGFDLLEILGNDACSVIFTTASDQHAIQAFQHEAVDYLLKPIDPDLLVKAVEKHRKRSSYRLSHKNQGRHNETNKVATISLSTQDDLRVVEVRNIVRLEADGNYTTVFEIDGNKTLVSRSLKSLTEELISFDFYRSHQSHLVNLAMVVSYLKSEGGFLKMKDGSEVPVAVRKKAEIVQILKSR